MGIQSPDIMADSVDTKQMLLTLNSKLDWLTRFSLLLLGLFGLNAWILRILALHFNKYYFRKAA